MSERRAPINVVIVGGGVAALEVLLGLRELAGDRVATTLVTAAPEFVERAMTVAEPFGLGRARRHPVDRIAAEHAAGLVQATVAGVDPATRRVILLSGDTLPYDILVLAPGATTVTAYDDAITFGDEGSAAEIRAMLDAAEQGVVRRVAFVAPTSAGWTLPLYELALMTARHAPEARLSLVTPEDRPLTAFGHVAAAEVGRLLQAFGIDFIGATRADVAPGKVVLGRSRPDLPVDRVVALPLVRGPKLTGVPAEREYGFIPVDRHGRVGGLDDVYAAGDATDFPIKQGGIACQQADAVAEHIASRAGAPVTPSPFRPVLRGMLFTGGDERYLQTPVGAGPAQVSAQPLWLPRTKIAGRFLAPYLLGADEPDAVPPPGAGFVDVEIPLGDAPPLPAGGAA